MIHVFNKLTNSGTYINPTHIILVDVISPLEEYKVILTGNNKVIVDFEYFDIIKKVLRSC